MNPTTLQEARTKRYGQWAGNEAGRVYNPDKCAYEMFAAIPSKQCTRPNGHGPDGLYCKQHARKVMR